MDWWWSWLINLKKQRIKLKPKKKSWTTKRPEWMNYENPFTIHSNGHHHHHHDRFIAFGPTSLPDLRKAFVSLNSFSSSTSLPSFPFLYRFSFSISVCFCSGLIRTKNRKFKAKLNEWMTNEFGEKKKIFMFITQFSLIHLRHRYIFESNSSSSLKCTEREREKKKAKYENNSFVN